MNRVAVFGGGMGGLSAAHELVERGFTVDVYERRALWGGKARSYGISHTGTEGREDLPAEHGFRFFPGFYKHIPDTMSRIPFPSDGTGSTVDGNLLQCLVGEFLQANAKTTIFPVRFPRSFAELRDRIKDLRDHGPLGFKPGELKFFLLRMLRIAVSCQERRMDEYEKIAWWDFVDAESKSPEYQNLLARGLTRSLVAMRAETASTRTVGDIMLQMIFYSLTPGASSDRVLNGPTSEVWIDPWHRYLESKGVRFHPETRLLELTLGADHRIASATVRAKNGTTSVVEADHYVAAVPVEVIAPLVAGPIAAAAPSLRGLGALNVQWMNGVQFYLGRDVPMVFGHSVYTNSSWSLTSISQPQFWREGERSMSRFGDGKVKGLLSVDISDWTDAGQYTTPQSAAFCTREEIIAETWAQVKAHLTHSHGPLYDSDLLRAHLDHDIECPTPDTPLAKRHAMAARRKPTPVAEFVAAKAPAGALSNAPAASAVGASTAAASPAAVVSPAVPITSGDPPMEPIHREDSDAEPLLVNTIDSWASRPEARTEIRNLFLASDYVRTHTDLATMEGANEAGRRAANAILDAVGSTAPRAAVFPLHEPWILAPFRAIDWVLYQLQGKPSPPVVPVSPPSSNG
jgi:uncharacterized protein with NAD-binding domain and iron-sulfur cluster